MKVRNSHSKISSNAAAPKYSDIQKKTPTQKQCLNTAGDTVASTLSKETPHADVPKNHPKIKEQSPSRTTSKDHLILLPSLLACIVIITIATMVFTLLITWRVTHH